MQRSNIMSLDAMQKIINSFRQVERKIDRLQEDFVAQTKTLNDLRIMVGSIQTGFNSPMMNEDTQRSKPEKQLDVSHGSLKRKRPHSPKVNKAKSYEPVVPKSQLGMKRPLKPKKTEVLKKSDGRGRSARKTVNELESGIHARIFQSIKSIKS